MVSIRSDDIRGRWGRLIDNTASFTSLDLSGQSSGITAAISGQANTTNISGQVSGFAASIVSATFSNTTTFAGPVRLSGIFMPATNTPWAVTIYKDGANIMAVNASGVVVGSGTEAVNVFDAAVSGASNIGPILVKNASGGYVFNSGLNLLNRSFYFVGESYKFVIQDTNVEATTVIKANFSGTLFDMNSTTGGGVAFQRIDNMTLLGQSGQGTGIDWFNTGGPYGVRVDNLNIEDFNVGMRLRRTTYDTFNNLMIHGCTTYGLWLDSINLGYFNNTAYFFGGLLLTNGTNVFVTRGNDVRFIGMAIEAAESSAVISTSGTNNLTFEDCSFEVNPGYSGQILVQEFGNNTQYLNNRFRSTVEYTAIKLDLASQNVRFNDNVCEFGVSGITCHIIAQSGGSGSLFIGNTRGTNTPGTIDWQVSGHGVTTIGNSNYPDMFDNASGTVFSQVVNFSGTANFAGPTLFSGTTNLQAVSGFNWRGVFTSGGVSGGSGASFSGMIPQGYISLQVSGNTVKIPFFN